MKWLRLYSSVLHDPKVQRLSPALFKHWVNILCLANEQEPRGVLPPVDDIAFALRIKSSDAGRVVKQLCDAGLLDLTENGQHLPHNWPQRQRESDDVAARVRDHRGRKAANQAESSSASTEHVTLQKRYGNVLDTDSDTDTEEETDISSSKSVTKTAAVVVETNPTRAHASTQESEGGGSGDKDVKHVGDQKPGDTQKTARQLVQVMRLSPSAQPSLETLFELYPRAPAWFVSEAASCEEYYRLEVKPARKVSVRLYKNWLERAESRERERERVESERSRLSAAAAGSHTGQATISASLDDEDRRRREREEAVAAADAEDRRANAELVSELKRRNLLPGLPRAVPGVSRARVVSRIGSG